MKNDMKNSKRFAIKNWEYHKFTMHKPESFAGDFKPVTAHHCQAFGNPLFPAEDSLSPSTLDSSEFVVFCDKYFGSRNHEKKLNSAWENICELKGFKRKNVSVFIGHSVADVYEKYLKKSESVEKCKNHPNQTENARAKVQNRTKDDYSTANFFQLIECHHFRPKKSLKFSFLQSTSDVLLEFRNQLKDIESFKEQIKAASETKEKIEHFARAQNELKRFQAFSKSFDSLSEFDRYFEKATAFQKEISKMEELRKETNKISLAEELKHMVFIRMRDQNYRASLKLEGLQPSDDFETTSLEAIRAKYAG